MPIKVHCRHHYTTPKDFGTQSGSNIRLHILTSYGAKFTYNVTHKTQGTFIEFWQMCTCIESKLLLVQSNSTTKKAPLCLCPVSPHLLPLLKLFSSVSHPNLVGSVCIFFKMEEYLVYSFGCLLLCSLTFLKLICVVCISSFLSYIELIYQFLKSILP